MLVDIDKSFFKSLSKLNNSDLNLKVKSIIISVEQADSIHQLKQIKKIQGFKSYFRIKLGDYRIGIELIGNNTILFILIAHRKDIYSKFP